MRPIKASGLLALGLFAFVLRGAVACVDSARPIFPSYYYADATAVDQWTRQTLEARSSGAAGPSLAPSHKLHVALLAAFYSAAGVSPLAAKLAHAAAGAAACVFLAAALGPLFGPRRALASAALLAAWPSAVFGSSQIMKDPLVMLLAYAAVWAWLPLLTPEGGGDARPRAAGGAAAIVVAGLLRSYVMLVVCAAFAAAALWGLRRRSPRSGALLAAAVLSPLLYLGASRALAAGQAQGDSTLQINFVPRTYIPEQKAFVSPVSPRAITEFRRVRQAEDQKWSGYHYDREIATQIYPEAVFNSWLDLAAFIPKGVFSALFMPFPGLYPTGGKPARLAAAWENVVLLLLAAAAAVGLRRAPLEPCRAALLLVFAFMTLGSALLEFDLGSATRHKAFYLPMLFPFAAAALPARTPAERRP